MPADREQVAIIGDGAWGTALGLTLVRNGFRVVIWGPFPDYIRTVRERRENHAYLPGFALPDALRWTSERAEACSGTGAFVFAVPTRYFREVAESFRGLIPPTCPVLSVAKGLDQRTHARMSQVASEALQCGSVAALSGPSYAEEVARGVPTAVTVASAHPDVAERFQALFSCSYLRVYTSDDIAGVELGGAVKNVIAIGVGVSDGLGFGDNTRAALITRGLAEMTRLGCAMGARASTFAGLSGMGDLIVTCTGKLSRNRSAGERMGRGESARAIMEHTKQAVEGVWNCAIVRELAHERRVQVPITEEVYAMVHCGRDPMDSVRSLMSRDVKPE